MTGYCGGAEAKREWQRFEHLVLGRPRPKPEPAQLIKPKGMSNREWKIERKRLIAEGATLAPGIEEAVRLREDWSHKAAGTPQTHEHAARTRQGALARLHLSGAISADQLAWALQIAQAAEIAIGGIGMKTASLEARIDVTRMGDGTFYEALGRARADRAYTDWRWRVRHVAPIGALLDLIVRDIGVTIVARQYRMSVRSARARLVDALDLWPQMLSAARREVNPASLAAAHAGLL